MNGINREWPILRSSLSLSIAVHILFFVLCAVLIAKRASEVPFHRTTLIELEPLPHNILNKDRANRNAVLKPNQRIVQTTDGQKTDKAAPDAFLGKQTQKVDRQTVSKDKQIQLGEAKSNTAKQDTRGKERVKRSRETVATKPNISPLKNLGLPILPTAKQLDDLAKQRAKGEDRSDLLARGEQAPKDYVKGLKEGETTALNTREFVFYSYYQRIRERLDRAWVPVLRHKVQDLYNRGRTLASEMDYSTQVLVVMDRGGQIIKVQIQTQSGSVDLDQAAVKAFNMAGPFPNPPKGMMDQNGEVKIPWQFILRT